MLLFTSPGKKEKRLQIQHSFIQYKVFVFVGQTQIYLKRYTVRIVCNCGNSLTLSSSQSSPRCRITLPKTEWGPSLQTRVIYKGVTGDTSLLLFFTPYPPGYSHVLLPQLPLIGIVAIVADYSHSNTLFNEHLFKTVWLPQLHTHRMVLTHVIHLVCLFSLLFDSKSFNNSP